MKRYYRNRFILGAMSAFLILLLVVISCILLFSYLRMEQDSEQLLSALLSAAPGERPAFVQEKPLRPEGLALDPRAFLAPFYDITLDATGRVLSTTTHGILDEMDSAAQAQILQSVADGAQRGRLGPYRFGAQPNGDGTVRVILMDNGVQLRLLFGFLQTSVLVGAGMMVLLFFILLPVASRVADSYLRNAEKQKQFITDAGHDLKTPVAIIRSNLDMMELLGGQSNWSRNIRGQVDRLERLIRQLLMMSRLDEKQLAGKMERTDVSALLRTELEGYQETLTQKELQLTAEIQPDLVCRADREALQQLIHVLMDNAVQYTPNTGRIRLEARRERKKLCLQLSNTVDVLPALAPEKLLNRFTRGNTARTQKTGGSGIGLSAAQSIAELHHGVIRITYPDAHRFQARVELPL